MWLNMTVNVLLCSLLPTIGNVIIYCVCVNVNWSGAISDTVGNKGALINITPDMKLDYVTFTAVVRDNNTKKIIWLNIFNIASSIC